MENNNYTKESFRRRFKVWLSLIALVTIGALMATDVDAQVSAYSFTSSSGTYSAISGGTNQTGFTSTTTYIDDDVAAALAPIGFNFVYNGVTYTQFGWAANGYLTLGSLAVNSTTPLSSGTSNNVISAMGADLIDRGSLTINRTSGNPTVTVTAGDINLINVGDKLSGTGITAGTTVLSKTATTITMAANATSTGTGSHLRFAGPNFGIRYETIGSSPTRTLVVQWTGFQRYTTTGAFGELYNFQIRLSETSNAVDIVYDLNGPSSATATTFQVGLRGTTSSDFNNRTSTTSWSSTSAGGTNASTLSLSSSVKPSSGLTYTFTPASCFGPSALTATSITTTSAIINWTAPGTPPSSYDLYYSTSATAPIGSTTPSVSGIGTTSTTLSSLTSASTYYVWVRGNCAGSGNSNWIPLPTFNTLCSSSSIPTTSESFDGTGAGTIPVCWTSSIITGSTAWLSATSNDGVPSARTGTLFMSKTWNNSDALIVSRPIDMTTSASGGQINVWIYRSTVNVSSDRIRFHANTAPNLTGASQLLEIFPLTTVAPTVASAGWYNYTVAIPSGFNSSTALYIIGQGTTSAGSSAFGIGFDDFQVQAIPSLDMSLLGVSAPAATGCYTSTEAVTATVMNASGVSINFATNPTTVTVNVTGAATQTFTTTLNSGTLAGGASQSVSLGTLDMSAVGTYSFNGTTSVTGDGNALNDAMATTTRTVTTSSALPMIEGFTSGLPATWTTTGWSVGTTHGNPNTGNGFYRNLYSSAISGTFTTLKVGPVASNSVLAYDYRIVDYTSYPATATATGWGNFVVQISTDCGATFSNLETVNDANHTVSLNWATRSINLSAYAGLSVIIRVNATWVAGDYYLDFDNWNIQNTCSGAPTAATIAASPAGPFCGSATTVLTATGFGTGSGVTYQWYTSPTSGGTYTAVSGATSATLNITAASSTAYYVFSAKCASDSSLSNEVGVIVNPAPSASISNSNPTFCSGGSSTLTASPSGSGESYLWSPGGATSASISASPGSTTIYTVTVTSTNGCTGSSTATVTVNQAPTAITVTPSTSTICAGGSQTLTATGGTVPGILSNTITINLSNPTTDEGLTCPGANTIASFTLPAIPGTVIGARLTMIGVASASGSYQSEVNLNFSGTGINANSLCLRGATGTTATPFDYITGSNVAGDTATLAGLLNTAGGTVDIRYSDTYNDNAGGPDATFPATATLQYYYNGQVPGTFTWLPTTTPSTGDVVSASPSSTTIYTATSTAGNGCTTTGTATVSVTSNTASISGSITTICPTETIVLTASGTGTITGYQWKLAGSPISGETAATYNATAPGSYTVDITADGCTVTSAAYVITATQYTITATAGANGSISPSGTVSVNCGDNQTFTITPAIGYQVDVLTVDGSAVASALSHTFTNVTANGHTIDVTFSVAPCSLPATANAGPNSSVCDGSNYTLVGTIGGSASSGTWSTAGTGTFNPSDVHGVATSYTPSPADISAGSVVLTLTTDDPAGACTAATSTVTLTFGTSPVTAASASCSILLANRTALLNANATGATAYQWSLNGTPIGGATSATYTTLPVVTVGSPNYTVVVTGTGGCTASSSVVLSTITALSGTYAIPGIGCTDFASIAASVTYINLYGVNGPVTFNVASGHTENAAAPNGFVMTASGTSTNPITYQKSGVTANPKISGYTLATATPASANPNGIWSFVGSDYVTIDGIDLLDASTVTPDALEFGYGFFKQSASNGAQNNTIKNCTITMARVNNTAGGSFNGSVGIAMYNATNTAATTGLTITVASGTSINNKFVSNTILNTNTGIGLAGCTSTSPFTIADANNEVGGTTIGTGNTITNFGGGGTAAAVGIRLINQYSPVIGYNTLNSNNGSGADHNGTITGISWETSPGASGTVRNNTVTLKGAGTTTDKVGINLAISTLASATNTITVSDNTVQNCTFTTATSGIMAGIRCTQTTAGGIGTLNYTGNIITGNTLPGTGAFTGIITGAATTMTATTNQITSNSKTGASGSLIGIIPSAGIVTVSGNTISGNTQSSATSTATAASFFGIQNLNTGAVSETYSNNVIRLNSISSNSSSTGAGVFGIYSSTAAASNVTVSGNIVDSMSYTSASTSGIGLVAGAFVGSGATVNISNNKVYELTGNGAGSSAYGLYATGTAATVTFTNNVVGMMKTPSSNAATIAPGGILSSSPNVTANYNTINLDASTSATTGNFSSAGLFLTGANVAVRNNIVVNTTASAAGGIVTAVQFGTATVLSASSNNNLYYISSPGPARLLVTFGSITNYQDLTTYKAGVTPRENVSVSENPSFANTTSGYQSTYLNFAAATSTLAESGGTNIAGITTDYLAAIRAGNVGYVGTGTSPDIGAYEFAGTNPALCTGVSAATAATSSASFCGSGIPTLSIVPQGAGITYQWQSASTSGGSYSDITGATSATYTPAIAQTATTYYQVVVTCTNGGASVTSSEIGVIIKPIPSASISPASPIAFCSATPTTMTASSSAVTPLYVWSLNGTAISGATSSTYVPLVTGSYTVRVTDDGCAFTSTAVAVTVNQTPNPSTTAGYAICLNATVPSGQGLVGTCATANPVSVSNQFTGAPFTSPGTSAVTVSTITLPAVPAGATGVSATLVLHGVNAINGSWRSEFRAALSGAITLAATQVSTTSSSGLISPDPIVTLASYPVGGGSVSLILSESFDDAGVDDATIASAEIILTYTPATTFGWYTASTGGSSISSVSPFDPIGVAGSGITNSSTPGNYTFYAECAIGGCAAARVPVIFSVGSPVSATLTASTNLICGTGSSTLTAVLSGGGAPFTYAWEDGSGPLPNTTSSISVSPTTTTSYTVTVTDGCGTTSSASTTITVNPIPSVSVSPSSSGYCGTGSVSLTASGATTYAWSPTTNLTPTTGSPVTASPTATTIYTVTGTTAGCSATATATVTVSTYTPAAPTATAYSICLNGAVPSGEGLVANCVTGTGTVTTSFTGAPFTSAGVATTMSTITLPALPAGVTGVTATLVLHSVTAINGSWRSEFRAALTGSITLAATQVSTTTSSGLISPDPIVTLPSYPLGGGSVSLVFSESYDDAGVNDATVASAEIVVSYTLPATTLNWYTSASGGTSISSNSPFDPIGVAGSGIANSGTSGDYTFYAECASGACASTRTPVVFSVGTAVGVSLSSSNSTLCGTGSSLLTSTVTGGGAPYTYAWSDGTGPAPETTSSLTVTPTTTTTYTVTVTDGCGTTASATATITVNTVPTVGVSGDSPGYCGTGTVNLTATGATSYTWNPTTALSPTTGATVAASPTSTTTYTVTGTSGGCSATATVTVTVSTSTPTAPTGAGYTICLNGTIPSGEGLTAACGASTATGTSSTSFTGGPFNVDFTSATVSTITLPALPVGATGAVAKLVLHTVTATGTSWRSEIRVALSGAITLGATQLSTLSGAGTLSPDPEVTLASYPTGGGSVSLETSDTYDDAGIDATIGSAEIIVTYTLPSTLNWYTASTGGSSLSGNSPFDPIGVAGSGLPNSSTAGNYTFYAECSNGTCASTRTPIVLSIGQPLTVSLATSVPSVCSGNPATLTATTAGGGLPYTYEFNDGTGSPGPQSSNELVVTPESTTLYTVYVTDACGGSSSSTVTVSVGGSPVVSASSSAAGYCGTGSVTLSASGADTYAWNPTTALTPATGTPVTANPTTTTIYTVTGTVTATGCTATSTVTVTVDNSNPTAPTATGYSMCLNGTIPSGEGLVANCASGTQTVTTPFTGAPFVSSGPATTVSTITLPAIPSGSTGVTAKLVLHSVEAIGTSWRSEFRAALSGSITLAATQVSTLTGVGLITPDPEIALASYPLGGGSVDLVLSESFDDGGDDATVLSAEIVVSYTLPPSTLSWYTTASGGTSISNNSPFDPIGVAGSGVPNSATAGSYTFYAECSSGLCASPRTAVVLSIGQALVVSASSSASSVCSGTSVNLSSSLTGGGTPFTYSWSDGTNTLGTTANISAVVSANTTYTVTVSDGCSNISSATVSVSTTASPIVTATPSASSFCGSPSGGSVTITAGGADTYLWSPAASLDNAGLVTVTASPTTTTTYTVVGTSTATGCTASATTTITVGLPVAVIATATPENVCIGGSSVLNANASLITPSLPYCTSGLGGATVSTITNVTFNTLNNSDATTTLYLSFPPSGAATTQVMQGSTYPVTVTTAAGTAAIVSVWIDYDQNGVFDATEWVQPFTNAFTGTSSITIPNTALTGITGMRVRSRSTGNTNGAIDACTNFGSGNTHDYQITIGTPTAPSITYSWSSVPAATLSSTTAQSPTASGLTANTAFTVVATDASGCTASATVNVNVGQPLVVTPSASQSLQYCQNGSVTNVLSTTITGGGAPYTYAWSNGSTTSSITVTSPVGINTYTVTVSDACGGSSTVSINDTANVVPVVTVSGNGLICGSGGSVTLTASGATTYSWSPAGGLDVTNAATVVSTPTVSTVYTVTGTTGTCTATATVPVVINSATTVTATADALTGCSPLTTVLHAVGATSGPLANYGFAESTATYAPLSGGTLSTASGDDGTQTSIPIGFAFSYNGSSYTTFGISTNGTIQLGTTATSYINGLTANANVIAPLWDDNNLATGAITYLQNGTIPNRVLTVDWSNIAIGGSGNAANPTNSFQLKLHENGNIQFSYGSLTSTNGITASIGLSGASGSFVSVTPGAPATSSTVTEDAGISSVANLPTGTVYTFTPQSPSYSWSPTTNMTGSTTANPTITALTSSETYTVTATGPGGCTATATVTLTVTPTVPAPTITSSAGTSICPSTSTTLDAGTGYTNYLWSPGGATTQTITVSPSSTTTYTVTVDNGPGTCSASSTLEITTYSVAAAVITPPGVFCTPGTATLNVTPTFSSYVWSTTATTPSISITTGGTYSVVVTDANGCTQNPSITVTSNPTPPTATITYTGGLTVCDDDMVGFDLTADITGAAPGSVVTWSDQVGSTGTTFNINAGFADFDDISNPLDMQFTVVTPAGCALTSGIVTVEKIVCVSNPIDVSVTAFIYGYYVGGQTMTPTIANELVAGATGAETDTITVQLYTWDGDGGTTPILAGSGKGVLMTDGTCDNVIVNAPDGSYYIALRHRNSLLTFSSVALACSTATPVSYDFTTDITSAAFDNMRDLGDGFFAIYNGDFNQDEYIDGNDFTVFDLQSTLGDPEDYWTNDMNGDGFVDGNDFTPFDEISVLGLESIVHP